MCIRDRRSTHVEFSGALADVIGSRVVEVQAVDEFFSQIDDAHVRTEPLV